MKIRLLGIRTACHPWIFLSTKTKIWIIYFPLSSNDARKYSFTPTHRHWHLFHSARYSQISLSKIDDITIHLIDARNIALFIRSLDLDLEGYNVTFRKNFLEFLSHSIVSSDRQGSKKWTNRFDALSAGLRSDLSIDTSRWSESSSCFACTRMHSRKGLCGNGTRIQRKVSAPRKPCKL